MKKQDSARWLCRFKLSKYREDIAKYQGNEAEFYRLFEPYEVDEGKGNCLLNTGINAIWTAVCGGSFTAFDNTYATLGVGDSNTTASAGQTDLQAAANKTYKGMDSGYPTYGSSQKVTYKASFGAGDANYAWNEWVLKNSSTGICLNRKVDSLGTKSGGTWTLQVDITLS